MFSALWKRAPVAKSPDLRDEFVTFASRTAPLVIKKKKRKDREVERIILERLESLAHKRENTANKVLGEVCEVEESSPFSLCLLLARWIPRAYRRSPHCQYVHHSDRYARGRLLVSRTLKTCILIASVPLTFLGHLLLQCFIYNFIIFNVFISRLEWLHVVMK